MLAVNRKGRRLMGQREGKGNKYKVMEEDVVKCGLASWS